MGKTHARDKYCVHVNKGVNKTTNEQNRHGPRGVGEGGGKFSSVSRHQNPATHKENCRLSLVDSLPERKKPHTCMPREGHHRLCMEKIQSAPAVYLDQTTEDRVGKEIILAREKKREG